ncbi:hypothetical protein F4V58_07935 [Corynebacterium phocae]|nr:hypothetical protein F4V58_07935 [Corynebacterium phocae]
MKILTDTPVFQPGCTPTCAQPEYKAQHLWDDIDQVNYLGEREDRETYATTLCHTCPALAACETYLRECEAAEAPVAGIVAGRRYIAGARTCVDCGEHKLITARERCSTCYARMHYHKKKARNAQKKVPCGDCGKKKPTYARGLCRGCYKRQRTPPMITCSGCGQDKPHESKGMCRPCYDKMRLHTATSTTISQPA